MSQYLYQHFWQEKEFDSQRVKKFYYSRKGDKYNEHKCMYIHHCSGLKKVLF